MADLHERLPTAENTCVRAGPPEREREIQHRVMRALARPVLIPRARCAVGRRGDGVRTGLAGHSRLASRRRGMAPLARMRPVHVPLLYSQTAAR